MAGKSPEGGVGIDRSGRVGAVSVGEAGTESPPNWAIGALCTSSTRLAKLAGPSPTLHHSTMRPSGVVSMTMP
ncbi:hypothetical protein F5X71_20780 [Nocardia brasiliensis]|uniref:Uncharacterized protein n=1 Tax=Nocardia brasiliensis TaxID=37326 RepID=A0A6G9XU43_NOCBR|nr:hypothetical protein [Nocardia brasiliensis]QIS04439.1 hypothetical protein F5X71_20780 [Nocardia brasiliensis]